MGLPTKEKEFIEDEFGDAFSWTLNSDVPHGVCIVDFMQFTKTKPDSVLTLGDLITHFKERVKEFMFRTRQTFHTVIILVDGKPMKVKRMISHTTRYKSTTLLQSVEGKSHLPSKDTDLVPSDWITFAGNYQLLQRELYPRLFNAFMFDLVPNVGQSLILSGFPGRSWYENSHVERPWECTTNKQGQVWQVQPWKTSELPISAQLEHDDADLYHRVYILENVPPCAQFPEGALVRREWEEAKNDVSEADIRMFYFEHWYQQENVVFCINDGDVFSIGLLYAFERHTGIDEKGKYVFRNHHTVMLRYKETDRKKKKREKRGVFITPPPYHYVDLNMLYQMGREYEPFRKGHVMNAVASFVFLLIMAKTDFFTDFLKGMTAQNVIWKVFFENIAIFSHMVQISEAVPRATRVRRHIVLDEDAFRKFVIFCYLYKYEPAMLTSLKVQKVTFKQLRERTQQKANGGKRMKRKVSPEDADEEDTGYHMPSRNEARMWCRQIEWNLDYWKNAALGHFPDPFELWYGVPYFPYYKGKDGKAQFIKLVSPRAKPVDRVYSQHFLKNRKRDRGHDETKEQAMQRKRKALKELK